MQSTSQKYPLKKPYPHRSYSEDVLLPQILRFELRILQSSNVNGNQRVGGNTALRRPSLFGVGADIGVGDYP